VRGRGLALQPRRQDRVGKTGKLVIFRVRIGEAPGRQGSLGWATPTVR
jgi:hypothetical protein